MKTYETGIVDGVILGIAIACLITPVGAVAHCQDSGKSTLELTHPVLLDTPQDKAIWSMLKADATLTPSRARWIVNFLETWEEYKDYCNEHPHATGPVVKQSYYQGTDSSLTVQSGIVIQRTYNLEDFALWLKRRTQENQR